MEKRLTIRFTSDMHGHVFPTNYRDRVLRPMGALGLIGLPKGRNSLRLSNRRQVSRVHLLPIFAIGREKRAPWQRF